MDNPTITAPRDQVPDWAKAEQEHPGHGGERMASQRQLNYIRDLITQKNLMSLTDKERAALKAIMQEDAFWDEKTTRLTFAKASRVLDKLIPLPKRPKDEYEPTRDMAERFAMQVPAGRYAVENDAGELRFYKVWVSRDGKRLNLYVEHGPAESDLKYQKTILAILNKIKTVGIRECAIRYGMEIGHCSNCGYRLTNRISRELGIGPICGGRMFGDDFKVEVKAKRKEIKERGENPDEKLF